MDLCFDENYIRDSEEKDCYFNDVYVFDKKKPNRSCFVVALVRDVTYIKLNDGTIYYPCEHEWELMTGYYDHLGKKYILMGSTYYSSDMEWEIGINGYKDYGSLSVDQYSYFLELIREKYNDQTIAFSDEDVADSKWYLQIYEWMEIDELSATGKMLMRLK